MVIKACFTDSHVSDHGLQIFDFHIAKGIRPDNVPDLLRRMIRSNELLIGRYVGSIITRIEERRCADPHMDLLCPCPF